MAWTNDQLKAIKTSGGKIIVSAAAGSGKTAVLSQRVLEYVLDGGNIDDLLIVTFTNMAALEMKGRIKNKLEQELLHNNEHLLKQLSLLDNAKITTMDAFYKDIVEQNFEKLGINKNFDILSSTQANLLKDKTIKKVLEDSFKYEDYKLVLDTLNANDINLIKDVVLKISNFLYSIPDYKNYINNIIKSYDGDNYKNLFLNIIKNNINNYKQLYLESKSELLSSSNDFDKLNDNFNSEISFMDKIIQSYNFDGLSTVLRTSEINRLPIIKNHNEDFLYNKFKNIRDNFKKEINGLSDYKLFTDKDYYNQINLQQKVLVTLLKVVNDYMDNLLISKKGINKFEFNDIPNFVYSLLIKNNKQTPLAKEISLKYKEILIDEYQDTNKLQNVIFNAISNNDNLFIVGDIKQSIYGFRGSCPEIFNNDKKKSYKDKFPMLINLSKNFRSRESVLSLCNFIFSNLMNDKFGDVNYDDNEKLYLGYDYEESNITSEICIIDGALKEEQEQDDLTKSQKEAIFVADKIKSILDSKQIIYDKNTNKYRNIKESDIVILLRGMNNSNLYRLALINKNISVYSDSKITYFNSYDVMLIISLLKVIDNYYDDISLMSVLKSDLFNINDEEIALLKINKKYDYLYNLIISSSNDKMINILKLLDDFNNYFNNNSIVDSITYLYKKLNIFSIIGTTKLKIKNLNLMINYAKEFEKDNSKTLHEFVSYIDEVINNKDSFKGQNPISEGENVLITTIHQSKGLEYPIVFLCDTGSRFNFDDLKSNLLLDENLGISFNIYKDYKKIESITDKIYKYNLKQKQLSEELRILYVALTRAREKIIITGYTNNLLSTLNSIAFNIGDEELISNLFVQNANNYLSWILACALRHQEGKVLRNMIDSQNKVFLSDSKFILNIIDANDIKDEQLQEEKENNDQLNNMNIINYNDSLSRVPLKLSVSDIKTKDHKYYRRPYFLNNDIRSTNIGTLYHKIFEMLPVCKYTISSLNATLLNIVTKDEIKLISLDKIFAYLTSDLYDDILKATKVYKEKQFVFTAPSNYYDNSLKSGNILLDGTVDLLFFKDDYYTIVDYKTDKVDSLEILVKMYKVQLDLYEIAIKEKYNTNNIKKIIYSVYLDKYIEI